MIKCDTKWPAHVDEQGELSTTDLYLAGEIQKSNSNFDDDGRYHSVSQGHDISRRLATLVATLGEVVRCP